MSQENELPKDPNKEFENLPVEITNSNNDNLGTFITNILKTKSIQDLIEKFATAKEKEELAINTREANFHSFLKRIDLTQKIYNIIFVIITCSIIYKLKTNNVIGQETAQTIFVFVIGLSMTDAISSFFKSSKNE